MDASLLLHDGHSIHELQGLLQHWRVQARPMHPGSGDAALALWFTLAPAPGANLAGALAALLAHPAVDAAYAKPEGEAPGG